MREINGKMLIIADHGNCDTMIDQFGNKVTAHSTALVPCILTDINYELNDGALSDVAPTLIYLMNLKKPIEMTGNNLIK
jgi:2,3-bisphosphoglycerate-independent phosphoglycerate mutase